MGPKKLSFWVITESDSRATLNQSLAETAAVPRKILTMSSNPRNGPAGSEAVVRFNVLCSKPSKKQIASISL